MTACIPPFPQIPQGDPGAIQDGVRSLRQAAGDLENAAGRVGTASGGLAGNWEGEAAAAYHGSAGALGAAARGVGETIRSSAGGAERFAALLASAQSGMRALKRHYDDVVRRYNAISGQMVGLESQLVGTIDHTRAARLTGQIGGLNNQQNTLWIEAAGYVTSAYRLLTDFEREQAGCMRTIAHGVSMPNYLGGPSAEPLPAGVPRSMGGPVYGADGVAGSLAAFGGILTLRVPVEGGGVLGTVETISGAISAAAGVCDAFGFWNPVADAVCGTTSLVSGGVSAAAGWARAFEGNGSVAGALEDTGLTAVGAGGYGMGKVGARLAEGGSDAGKAAGPALQAGGAQVGGVGSVYAGGTAVGQGLSHHGHGHAPAAVGVSPPEPSSRVHHPEIAGSSGELVG